MKNKMIRVVSRGIVSTSRGRVMSPIMYPYKETIDRIWNMITKDRADIDEQLPDGSFVRLTVQNYDKDNTIKNDVATKTPVQVVSKPVEHKNEEPEDKKTVEVITRTLVKEEPVSPIETVETERVETPIEEPKETVVEPVEPSVEEQENEAPAETTEVEPTDSIDSVDEEVEVPVEHKEVVTPQNSRKNRKRNKNRQENKVDGASISVTAEEV